MGIEDRNIGSFLLNCFPSVFSEKTYVFVCCPIHDNVGKKEYHRLPTIGGHRNV